MGLFDRFRKKNQDDGTYRRDRSRDGEAASYGYRAGAGDGFRFTIQDVFTITGRGTVVTGQVEAGSVMIGDIVKLSRLDGSSREVAVTGIEMFRKMMDVARQEDNAGLLLRGVGRNEVSRGDVLEKI